MGKRDLTKNNKPTQVIVHTVGGPKMMTKYIYRCRGCKISSEDQCEPQDVYYHPDKVIVNCLSRSLSSICFSNNWIFFSCFSLTRTLLSHCKILAETIENLN